MVELGEVVHAARETGSPTIFRRDGRFADMVMADLAGAFEAPIYGMLDVARAIDAHDWGSLVKPMIRLHGQPADESRPSLLWDGEWEITYTNGAVRLYSIDKQGVVRYIDIHDIGEQPDEEQLIEELEKLK